MSNDDDNNQNAACSDIIQGNGLLSSNISNGRLPGQKDLIFQFSNVNYTIKQNRSKLVKVLDDACGEFKSGRLTGILGPSGAGKTSMLNVLSGFKVNGVSGHFRLNNEERNLLAFRKMSCYIPQDFALLDLLTVQETLNDSTDLKLPMETGKKEKNKIIDNILQILNMDKCRNTLVKNLSGGERKRLSIAIELVTNPPIMFFDEPISGLDSVASLQIINYLRRLACDGRIIVCVVHQPSSRLMKLFDDVLVMSSGRTLYSGAQSNMVEYFEEAGFQCPNYYNPADFVLEVGSEEHNEATLSLIQRNKEIHCKDATSSADVTSYHVDEKNAYTNTNKVKLEQQSSFFEHSKKFRTRNCESSNRSAEMIPKTANLTHTTIEMSNANDKSHHEIPREKQLILGHHCEGIHIKSQVSIGRQFAVLTRRSFRSMSRNLIAVQLRVIMHIIVALLLGVVFWDIGNDAAKVLTNSSCIFFLVLFVFFGNAMPSILLCPQETAVFIREYLNGWYTITAYYIAKIISDIPMQFICPTFFISIVYFMTGQPIDIGRFVMCWGISLLTAVIGHFMGLVFGSTFDMQMAVFLVPSLTIPFLIFSGFFIRIHELASYLRPLCDISFFRYTLEGFMQAIYGYDRDNLECAEDFCYFKSPQKFLKELDMWGERYGRDISALLIWICVFKVLFFMSLVLRIKKSQ